VLNKVGAADQVLEKAYMDHCNIVLDTYCAKFASCSFANARGYCRVTREGHVKGHQDKDGKIIGTGSYRAALSVADHGAKWSRLLSEEVRRIERNLRMKVEATPQAPQRSLVSTLHATALQRLYQSPEEARKCISHLACFCCLCALPEHPLPCGHVLCSACVQEYGSEGENEVFLHKCPLHSREPSPRWRVCFKPKLAGVRILSLDGCVTAWNVR
jgi:hypothetical protein